MRKKRLWALSLIGGVLLMSGCSPKFVNGIYTKESGDRAKFLYVQQQLFWANQGMIECRVASDGELSDCAEKPIIYND